MEQTECNQMRISADPFEFLNKTYYVKQIAGKDLGTNQMRFGEDIFMTFDHPNIPTAFGSLTKQDLKRLKNADDIDNFRETVKNMKQEEIDLLSDQQKRLFCK